MGNNFGAGKKQKASKKKITRKRSFDDVDVVDSYVVIPKARRRNR